MRVSNPAAYFSTDHAVACVLFLPNHGRFNRSCEAGPSAAGVVFVQRGEQHEIEYPYKLMFVKRTIHVIIMKFVYISLYVTKPRQRYILPKRKSITDSDNFPPYFLLFLVLTSGGALRYEKFTWRKGIVTSIMKRCIVILFVLALFMPVVPVWGQEWKESIKIGGLFTDAQIRGTFVLYDVSGDNLVGYNQERAKTRFIPASTFKIFNTLIGLSVGSVKDVDEILPWGGAPQPVKAWENDMSLRKAIIISNIPIYQELARRTGLERMRAKIFEIGYGNREIGDVVDRFWLDGPLKISAVEQAHLLVKLAQGELPFSSEIQAEARDIVKLEEGPNWTLYGKTGTAASYEPQVGWWVGWVERSGRIYAFALNIDMTTPEDIPKRMDVGKACLKVLNLL